MAEIFLNLSNASLNYCNAGTEFWQFTLVIGNKFIEFFLLPWYHQILLEISQNFKTQLLIYQSIEGK